MSVDNIYKQSQIVTDYITIFVKIIQLSQFNMEKKQI